MAKITSTIKYKISHSKAVIGMAANHPHKRDLGRSPEEKRTDEKELEHDRERSPETTQLPWIDLHVHPQTLSWNDRDKFALSGCQAMVMIATNYHWTPYRPVQPDDVQFLWDFAVKWTDHITRGHFYETYAGIGIHTLARVENSDELLEILPQYAELDEVAFIGETGIEPVQYTSKWDLEDQKHVVQRQMEIAADADLPFNVHTPVPKYYRQGWDEYLTDPQLDYPEAKLEATKIDVELMDDTNLSDTQMVIDHADDSIIPFVMENTNCPLSFSIGSPWRGVDAEDIANAVKEYGPDRIMFDSDLVGNMYGDMFAMKRTILDLKRFGLEHEEIRQIAYENQKEFLGLDLPE